ncbi:universal stress protein [Anaerobacillus alkalidiazotrophicus]|uniref:Universal stress protein n=1 Tax=Anaerobacillus alkalidiazotrophicus TaxID=472963 RepID=A0A1S2MC94_9BACI|nr:universal stress protein [Anaerobacillus alkalidiazotrophicus]OIJ22194.1 universal stress protein [Anaerobacillus alkalidiazotrophicus]
MFNKILLASDGSEYAIRATEKAMEVAKCNNEAVIHIVYVADDSKGDVLQNWNTAGAQNKRKEKIKPSVEKVESANIKYEVKYLHGEPGPAIVKHANENDFDLVVVGSRGRNRLQELVLGSVSHKVAKRANCAVMIIK